MAFNVFNSSQGQGNKLYRVTILDTMGTPYQYNVSAMTEQKALNYALNNFYNGEEVFNTLVERIL